MYFCRRIKFFGHIDDDSVEILEFSMSDSQKWPISKIEKITFWQKFLRRTKISAKILHEKNL